MIIHTANEHSFIRTRYTVKAELITEAHFQIDEITNMLTTSSMLLIYPDNQNNDDKWGQLHPQVSFIVLDRLVDYSALHSRQIESVQTTIALIRKVLSDLDQNLQQLNWNQDQINTINDVYEYMKTTEETTVERIGVVSKDEEHFYFEIITANRKQLRTNTDLLRKWAQFQEKVKTVTTFHSEPLDGF